MRSIIGEVARDRKAVYLPWMEVQDGMCYVTNGSVMAMTTDGDDLEDGVYLLIDGYWEHAGTRRKPVDSDKYPIVWNGEVGQEVLRKIRKQLPYDPMPDWDLFLGDRAFGNDPWTGRDWDVLQALNTWRLDTCINDMKPRRNAAPERMLMLEIPGYEPYGMMPYDVEYAYTLAGWGKEEQEMTFAYLHRRNEEFAFAAIDGPRGSAVVNAYRCRSR